MRGTLLSAVAIVMIAAPATAQYQSSYGTRSSSSGYGSTGDHYVTGHTTESGTYVQGHMATNPNNTRNDNYSTRGNVNPYTGEAGTKPRDGEGNPY
jgi:hypothetical protein